MKLSKYKVIFRYKNITLWRYNKVLTGKLTSRKWLDLNNKRFRRYFKGNAFYICHYKKLKIERIYYFKFINKQILRKYFINYKEYNFKNYLLNNYLNFERRLDFNIYKAHFAKSLYESRFFIVKGFVLVNNRKITTFNYLLKKNDKIEINSKFFNLIFGSINILNINDIYYIKNLEIDYKTLSFIFLDKKEFYILNYKNFFKHIYCLHKRKNYFSIKYKNVDSNLERKILKKNNNSFIRDSKLNNFFRFFDFILKYYIFLDKKHIFLKKKNYKNFFLTDFESKILFKFLKKKYNNFFFRNLLLKRIFNYKYNYLYYINNVFQNYYDFENISYIFAKNLKNDFLDLNIKNINFQYFKYYYNLIFKYYIYLLQNYYIYFDSFSFNVNIFNYNSVIFLNLNFFKILYIKNKLTNYYFKNFNKNLNLDNKSNNKFRILKYKYIKQFTKKVPYNRKKFKYYLTCNSYINFLYYINSNHFYLKYYKHTWDKRIQFLKKYEILKKFSNSFLYKYYNISKFGIYPKIYTKRYIFNKLITNTKKANLIENYKNFKFNNKYLRFLLKNHLYFSITSDIYKFIYDFVIQNQILEKDKLKNNFYLLNSLIKDLNLNKKDYKNILKSLKLQYYVLNNLKNFNYNTNIKNIYLLINLIKFYKKNIYDLNFKHNNYFTVLYKSSLKRNKYRFFNYSIFVRRRDRILIEPIEKRINIYIKYNKPKLLLSSNLRKYFLINKNIKYNIIKVKYNKFKNFFINKRKNFIINKHKKDLNYVFNLEIISSDLKFNDSLFFKDLFLNLTTRKLNILYNIVKFNYINKNKFLDLNVKNIINNKNNSSYINRKNLNLSKWHHYYFLYYNNFYKFNQNLKKYTVIRKLNTTIKIIGNKDLRYYVSINKRNIKFKSNYFYFYYINRNINKYKNNKNIGFKDLNFYKKYNNIKIYNPFLSKYFYNFNSIFNIYFYYSFLYRKYKIVKYIFNNYIFKEYLNILDNYIIKSSSIKTYNYSYIKQLYFNLLYSELFNFKKYDYLLKNNFRYSRRLKIIINYLILINRFYR